MRVQLKLCLTGATVVEPIAVGMVALNEFEKIEYHHRLSHKARCWKSTTFGANSILGYA